MEFHVEQSEFFHTEKEKLIFSNDFINMLKNHLPTGKEFYMTLLVQMPFINKTMLYIFKFIFV